MGNSFCVNYCFVRLPIRQVGLERVTRRVKKGQGRERGISLYDDMIGVLVEFAYK